MRITSWLIMAIVVSLASACSGNQASVPPTLNEALSGAVDADAETTRTGDADAEATRSVEPVSDIGELRNILRTEEIFTFGGLFLEREPRRRLVVQFTRDGEEIIRRYVTGGVLEGIIIEVRTVAVTADQLKIAQRKAVQFAEALGIGVRGIDFHTASSVPKNRVELIVPDPNALHARASALNLPIPDNVVVVEGGAPRFMEEIGGVLVERSGCLRLAESLESEASSRAIVWQKHVFEIIRVGDEVRIDDVQLGDPDDPVIWNLGDSVTAAGASDFGPPEYHAGKDFTESCAGPYVLISDVR